MLYFDYCATTPPFPEAIQALHDAMLRVYGNPSSLHRFGVQAEKLLEEARTAIARQLALTDQHRILFTSGGTESNNLAIFGTSAACEGRGKHLITTSIEHDSVLGAFERLAGQGFTLTILPVDSEGIVDPDMVRRALRKDTILVSVMHANNETGSLQPIEEIGHVVREHSSARFHVDAVQSVGHVDPPISYGRSELVDLMSVSAHKHKGPKGAGLLIARERLPLEPMFAGGGQEDGLRSGTQNAPTAASLAKALRLTLERTRKHPNTLQRYRSRILACLEELGTWVINTPLDSDKASPHIVNASLAGMKGEVLVHALEQEGIAVSTRSACSSAKEEPSRVLTAMGLPRELALSSIRISFSLDHTDDEIDQLCKAIMNVTRRFQHV